jgi:ribonuclease P protein component
VERASRLRKGTEFDNAYSKGTVVGGPLVVVRHSPNSLDATRWGFAIGKRLARHATDRNRTKRRLRACAEKLQVIPGIDIIVTARNGAIEAPYGDLCRALERTLRKANLLQAAPGA